MINTHNGVTGACLRIISLVMILTIPAFNAYAAFSAHELITPHNQAKHDFDVRVNRTKSGDYKVVARLGRNLSAWLVVCKRKMNGGTIMFRSYIWGQQGRQSRKQYQESAKPIADQIVSVKSLSTYSRKIPDPPGSPTGEKTAYYTYVTLTKSQIRTSYIHIDFSVPLFDGGVYYTIDLGSFIK